MRWIDDQLPRSLSEFAIRLPTTISDSDGKVTVLNKCWKTLSLNSESWQSNLLGLEQELELCSCPKPKWKQCLVSQGTTKLLWTPLPTYVQCFYQMGHHVCRRGNSPSRSRSLHFTLTYLAPSSACYLPIKSAAAYSSSIFNIWWSVSYILPSQVPYCLDV